MREEDAFLLEAWLVAKFLNYGHRITNLTWGGEGTSGRSVCSVVCSTGKVFISASEAAEWLRCNGFPRATSSSVSNVVNGKRLNYCGMRWAKYNGGDPLSYHDDKKVYKPRDLISLSRTKTVYCSNGMSFKSLNEAAKWATKENGFPVDASSMSRACRNLGRVSYGYAWSYDGVPPTPDIIMPVECNNGMIFDNYTSAAKWVASQGVSCKNNSHILSCARGCRKSAYGYTWRFVEHLT